jgi:glycosyltransferase involved in cell wall biosynthesis
MKVFIADFDLFSKVGGGQTFYQRLIETNPNIQFYYLIDQENFNNKRPNNAHVFPYKQTYIKADLKNFSDELPLDIIARPFLFASNVAASVTQENFHIIDCPDYQQYGIFLGPALAHYHVKFKKIILSLHGKISRSLQLDWYVNQEDVKALDFAEKLQYQVVDIRYGISKDYLEEWQQLIDINAYYFNPLHFLEILPKNFPKITNNSPEKPSLNYLGRKEKCKGSDIFVNLVGYLPRYLYSHANIIGPDSELKNGKTSQHYLQEMLDLRLSDISLLPQIDKQEINKIFKTKSITFLPSRSDTLNLIALESLFAGCPTVIGNGAGVCRFLEDNFPQIPFVKLDVHNIYNCLDELVNILENYDDYRQKLINALKLQSLEIKDLPLDDIYSQSIQTDLETRKKLANWYQQLINHCHSRQYLGKAIIIDLIKTTIKPTYEIGKKKLANIKQTISLSTGIYQKQLLKSFFYRQQLNSILKLPENSDRQLNNKLQQLSNLSETINSPSKNWQNKLKSGYLIDRVTLWREIARLEAKKENDLLAATYQLRVMRLLGQDYFKDLNNVIKTLNQKGFSHEAKVAKAMYNNMAEREKNCTKLLEEAYQNHLHYSAQEYEFIADRRGQNNYKVSLIVSLYKAASKLTRFLEVLAHQTLIKKQQVEVILIDSGSPDQEYQVFEKLSQKLDIPIVYVRSKKKETIQNAWNRGILLSQSPYLTFLGVDEMMIPPGLEILAKELDRDVNLDWVVGHSLVTNVDAQGNYLNDIMLYDRRNFDQKLVYLDTCYLTYVGGLYRRNIHNHFGYYDSSFQGAGDTEFKKRILPHIKCKMIDQVLGIFWNYPDQRTTQTPLAEIEDLRAWYLHRTLAGIKYAFKKGNLQDAEKLLYYSLGYRKSFSKTPSTDIDYAYYLAQFLAENKCDSETKNYWTGIQTLLKTYQNLEKLPSLSSFSHIRKLWRSYQIVKKVQKQHQSLAKNMDRENFNPQYHIFNDNRFEQHSNLW